MYLCPSLYLCVSLCGCCFLSVCLSLPPRDAFVNLQLRLGEASEDVILLILTLQVTLLVDICVTPEIQKELLNRWEPDLCK